MSAEGQVEHQNKPKRLPLVAAWVRFGIQLDYSCRLKSVSSDGENRVALKYEQYPRTILFLLMFNDGYAIAIN